MKSLIAIIFALAAFIALPASCQSLQNLADEANGYFLAGDYERAVTGYDEAIKLEPNSTALWNNRGKALGMLGRYEEAISSFDRSIVINSTDPESLNLKAIALSQGQQMHGQATLLFDRVLKMNSSYYDAWIGKGMALGYMEDLDGALQCFENAIVIDPKNPSGWNNKGAVLLNMQSYEDALVCFNQALLIDPLNEAALRNRENTLSAMNQFETSAPAQSYPSQSTMDMD